MTWALLTDEIPSVTGTILLVAGEPVPGVLEPSVNKERRDGGDER